MNKIVSRLLPVAVVFVVASCATKPAPQTDNKSVVQTQSIQPRTVACGNSTDYFRLNMEKTFSANYPASPAPISPTNMWVDVQNWQCFLDAKGYNATTPPNDTFGTTRDFPATEAFQTWAKNNGYPTIKVNGVVDIITYNAAVANGMMPYPTVTVGLGLNARRLKHHHHGGVTPTPAPSKQ